MQPDLRAKVEEGIQTGTHHQVIHEMTQMERLLYQSTEFHFSKSGVLHRQMDRATADYEPVLWVEDLEMRETIREMFDMGLRIHPEIFRSKELFQAWAQFDKVLRKREDKEGKWDVFSLLSREPISAEELENKGTIRLKGTEELLTYKNLFKETFFTQEEPEEAPPEEQIEEDPWAFQDQHVERDRYFPVCQCSNRAPSGTEDLLAKNHTFHTLRTDLEDLSTPHEVAQFRTDLHIHYQQDIELLQQWSDSAIEKKLAEEIKKLLASGQDEETIRVTIQKRIGWLRRQRIRELSEKMFLKMAQWRELNSMIQDRYQQVQETWEEANSQEGKRARRLESNRVRDHLCRTLRNARSKGEILWYARYAKQLGDQWILWKNDLATVKEVARQTYRRMS